MKYSRHQRLPSNPESPILVIVGAVIEAITLVGSALLNLVESCTDVNNK